MIMEKMPISTKTRRKHTTEIETEERHISTHFHTRVPFPTTPKEAIVLARPDVDLACIARVPQMQVHDLVAEQVVEHVKGGLRACVCACGSSGEMGGIGG